MTTDLKKNDPLKASEYFANKVAFSTGPVELDRRLQEGGGIIVIDVREEEDYQKGHIPGAVNLPRDRWPTLQGLQKDTLNVIYCYSHVCHLAAAAAAEFASYGYSVMEMDGGFEAWRQHDLKIEKTPVPRLREHQAAFTS
jgi:rhodanese-related sulfurtransferase